MELALTRDQRAFRDDLRRYLDDLMTPELSAEVAVDLEGGGPEFRAAMARMGADGMLGQSWPARFGGRESSAVEQFIFADEVQAVGFPLPFLTLNTVGPVIMEYGTEEQQAFYCPRILAGELFFAIGYSEPDAGTDLAALTTRAVRDGDEWVITGQKMWTSMANYADYIWLAARTDPDVDMHAGLSIFIVPTSDPGYSYQRVTTVGGVTTNATFYDEVRVPAENLIGGENRGWELIVGQLNRERISLMTVGRLQKLVHDVTAWARETEVDGQPVIERQWVRHTLASVHAKAQALRLMNWKQAWAADRGRPDMAESSAIKVFGSELNLAASRSLLEVLGTAGLIERESPGAVLAARALSGYLNGMILTFGGGTNEIQRDIIAGAGLGLPSHKGG